MIRYPSPINGDKAIPRQIAAVVIGVSAMLIIPKKKFMITLRKQLSW